MDSATGIEISVPLHPHHVPTGVHVDCDMGEALKIGDRVRWNVDSAWRGQPPRSATPSDSEHGSKPG